ncbi:DUF339-domain-containing protein [Xylariaceae sp. FL0594]|nr:DUF339-domain-containing protein [Xylariaceae sp. FL0594]
MAARTLLRPVRHALACARAPRAPRAPGMMPTTATMTLGRAMATAGNLPPMEPQKQRPREFAVGELEGASFRVEPLRRVGEDDKTMRARLVYQSRKRGILETDLLLSTFADLYLPTMTREQMADYDLFLDENDWDIYYWATQEEPTSTSTSTSGDEKNVKETDTSSPSYGSSEEAATAESFSSSSTGTGAGTVTGGTPLTGEHADTKASASSSSSSSSSPLSSSSDASSVVPPTPYAGEWAQTVGTFKPAYRPVPERWRDSEVLRMLREHVRARSGQKGGMAFMPNLK